MAPNRKNVAVVWAKNQTPPFAPTQKKIVPKTMSTVSQTRVSVLFERPRAMRKTIGAVMAAFVWTTPDLLQLFWLLAVGAFGMSAHYCVARALALADATIVVPMDFMRLPLIVLVAFVLYGESAQLLVLLGAVIIFAGNYYSIRREHRLRADAVR